MNAQEELNKLLSLDEERPSKAPNERLMEMVSDELIREIVSFCPHKLPNPKDTDREIWMSIGEQRLIEKLKVLNASRKNSKKGTS